MPAERTPPHPPRAAPIAHSTLICTGCGASTEFELDILGMLGHSALHALGAEILSHRIELRGRCAVCQALARPRERWGEV